MESIPSSSLKSRFLILKNNRWGAIDREGNAVIPLVYDYLSDFCGGLAVGRLRGHWGIVAEDGTFTRIGIDPDMSLGQGLFSFRDRTTQKKGVVSAEGRIVVPPDYDSVSPLSDGLMLVERDGRWGAVEAGGNVRIPPVYYSLGSFQEGLAPASKGDGGYGFINKNNEPEIGFQFSRTYLFHEGLAEVHALDTYLCGFVDREGALQIPARYDWVNFFADGCAPAALERGKIGYIDHFGEWVIPPSFPAAAPFSEGLAGASLDWHEERCGYVDRNGDWRVDPVYNSIQPFIGGLAFVQGPDRHGQIFSAWIDSAGHQVWGPGDDWYPG